MRSNHAINTMPAPHRIYYRLGAYRARHWLILQPVTPQGMIWLAKPRLFESREVWPGKRFFGPAHRLQVLLDNARLSGFELVELPKIGPGRDMD